MSSDSNLAIRVVDLSKVYRTGRTEGMYRYRSLREDVVGRLRRNGGASDEREHWALRDVSFDVAAGETVGVIGRNGAGKSTLFKVLSKITPPSAGRIERRGRLGSLLEVGTGFHPELTGRENILLSGTILGMRRADVTGRMDDIIDFSGIKSYLDTPVKRYSSGMYLRLAFAVAAHLEPDVLLVDEVLAVGDAEFQQKCLGKMAEVGASGRTVLFVSHSMQAIARLCPRVILLDRGSVVADGPTQDVIRTYLDSGLGTSVERSWSSAAEAPGDAIARMKSVRVLHGGAGDEVDIRSPIRIAVEYWRLTRDPDIRLAANIHVTNGDGVALFTSADFRAADGPEAPPSAGVVVSTCEIPPNFLAEGRVVVMAAVSSVRAPSVVHAMEPDVVAFDVIDRSTGDGVRGEYTGDWPGVVRPDLRWTLQWRPLDDTPPASPEAPPGHLDSSWT